MKTEPQGRARRLLQNGFYSVLSWAMPLILAVVVTPIVVKGLGNEVYGLYAVILGFVSYSFSFGVGRAATKYVAEFRAAGEHERVAEIISSVLWISVGFGLLAVCIITLTVKYLVANVLLISQEMQPIAVNALYIASVTILIAMLSQVFQSVLQGLQRFDRFLLLTNINSFLLAIGSVVIVIQGYGVIVLLLWNLILSFVMGLTFYFVVKRLLPELTFTLKVSSENWKTALRYALSIVAFQIFGNMLLLFERGWIVHKFGTETLAYYVVPMMLCFYFHNFISSLVLVLFPMVNELLDNKEKLIRLYRTSSKIILILTAFFVVTSITVGRQFLSVWMDDHFAAVSYPIFVMHVGTFAVLSIVTVAWQTIESFRAATINAFITFLLFVITVPLMIVFADWQQAKGVALARFVGILIFFALIWIAEKKFLKQTGSFWPGVVIRIVIATAFSGVAEWITVSLFEEGWIAIVAATLLGGIVFVTALITTRFVDEEEKEALKSLVFRKSKVSGV
jgi:O-antigen/teichoic acid export membrane protein